MESRSSRTRSSSPPTAKIMAARLITDAISVGLVGLPVLLMFSVGSPFKRGLYCDDESIRYPFEDSTVTSTMLYIYGISIPVVTIIIVEGMREFKGVNGSRVTRELFGWRLYEKLIPFGFGALSSQLLTDIAKYTIGRMRPHFFSVCRPFYRGNDLSLASVCDQFKYQYLVDIECHNPDATARDLKEARLSFMSGHSSFSAFCMVYAAIYLQRRVTWPGVGLVKHLLQVLVLSLAFYTGLSRVSDYKHHWSDVLIGQLQGTVTAIVVARYVSDLFADPPERNTAESAELNSHMNSSPKNYNSMEGGLAQRTTTA